MIPLLNLARDYNHQLVKTSKRDSEKCWNKKGHVKHGWGLDTAQPSGVLTSSRGPGSIPSTIVSQLPVSPVSADPVPSSGICRHCMHAGQTHRHKRNDASSFWDRVTACILGWLGIHSVQSRLVLNLERSTCLHGVYNHTRPELVLTEYKNVKRN